MDQGTLGAIATVLAAIAFVGIAWWTFSPKRKKRFDDAAQLPFADEDDNVSADEAEQNHSDPSGTSPQEQEKKPQSTDDVARRN